MQLADDGLDLGIHVHAQGRAQMRLDGLRLGTRADQLTDAAALRCRKLDYFIGLDCPRALLDGDQRGPAQAQLLRGLLPRASGGLARFQQPCGDEAGVCFRNLMHWRNPRCLVA
jgi:hypothetical protein